MSVDKATIVADLYNIGISSADISRLILWHGDDQGRLLVISSILKNPDLSNAGKNTGVQALLSCQNISSSAVTILPSSTTEPHRISGGLWE